VTVFYLHNKLALTMVSSEKNLDFNPQIKTNFASYNNKCINFFVSCCMTVTPSGVESKFLGFGYQFP
jgi:hypothetical protein